MGIEVHVKYYLDLIMGSRRNNVLKVPSKVDQIGVAYTGERRKCNSYLFSLFFELSYLVEYHVNSVISSTYGSGSPSILKPHVNSYSLPAWT